VNSASAPAATPAYTPKTSAAPPARSKTPVSTKKNAGTGKCSDATEGSLKTRTMLKNIFVGNVALTGGLVYIAVLGPGGIALVDL
jgi:hypothetical protein